MTSYRVTFFKNLVNSSGHRFKCPQGTVEIRRARNLDRAFQAAERRYERQKKIGNWTLYADVAELETVETDGNSLHLVEPASHEHFMASPCERRGAIHRGYSVSHPSSAL
ncbi:MAG: hypothetical protein E5X80_19750 [Mesorhizobium sp.]|uniref:hypothetical protein n=1 Tax=Mesorhizobium sp. TaxID=1871066 RepID=UPI000FE9EEE8|nr:hypothetical protein [Mesorhizobium sp.]RWM04388.1 MAG: hypothetical protein EOR71_26435 [Mesorhizobium sp.]TIO50149.1 MAG: hypothetical protein E5X78_22900 [Mesorhizobium sp.]TIO57287.1 MAG: hypothetical protein E5X79_26820 [Mesorhizobium sp.]TJV61803.1 MAG: hypothetical protein E5X80_19750 [Mesorhizobium sp.]